MQVCIVFVVKNTIKTYRCVFSTSCILHHTFHIQVKIVTEKKNSRALYTNKFCRLSQFCHHYSTSHCDSVKIETDVRLSWFCLEGLIYLGAVCTRKCQISHLKSLCRAMQDNPLFSLARLSVMLSIKCCKY